MDIPTTGNPATDAILQVLAPVVEPAIKAQVDQATQSLSGDVAKVQGGLDQVAGTVQSMAQGFAAHKADVERQLAATGEQILAAAAKDPLVERALVLGGAGSLAGAALMILGFDLAGSHEAARLIAAAPALGTAAFAPLLKGLLAGKR